MHPFEHEDNNGYEVKVILNVSLDSNKLPAAIAHAAAVRVMKMTYYQFDVDNDMAFKVGLVLDRSRLDMCPMLVDMVTTAIAAAIDAVVGDDE